MLKPMLASLADAPLVDADLAYEPKYDGIRAIAEVSADRTVRLWSRLGNDKTSQFPEIAAALTRWAGRRRSPVVLDGEIVALDAKGRPTGFQQLQGRIHVAGDVESLPGSTHVAFIAFDLLKDGATDWRERPLLERRAALERLMVTQGDKSGTLRLSELVRGDGRALYGRAIESGWEGLIAKHIDSRYKSGKRTPDWRKLKIVHEQEFVVAGWTEPRHARAYFGALLLGVYDGDALVYVGHTGTGFGERELARLMALLRPLATSACPFKVRPKSNERPHWVEPTLVVQVKFTEWTTDAKLRHPVYLGLRDDKRAIDVHREASTPLHASSRRGSAPAASVKRAGGAARPGQPVATPVPRTGRAAAASPAPPAPAKTRRRGGRVSSSTRPIELEVNTQLVEQLQVMEDARQDGVLDLGDGQRLAVTNLHKLFWPKPQLTKGDLFRYYLRVAPFILPAIADRPLVMKRFPNGVGGKPFYQHRAADVPKGVRLESVPAPGETSGARSHIIGGALLTLLYTTQLAALSQDPWFSRVESPAHADYAALDLDPSPGVSFRQVLDVARWIRDELASIGAAGMPKTSGADGVHIYIPLPPGTPYEAGLLFCQIIATVVANKHPREATIERSLKARGKRVYVDFLQNSLGKTLASAYSARASDDAGVSTPLEWDELDRGVSREEFTITTVPGRLAEVGDLWSRLRESKGVDLARAGKFK